MHHEGRIIIEITGEGKTDIGPQVKDGESELPQRGIVPIIVHALCGKPKKMYVKRYRLTHLQGRKLWQKVRFARRQAYYNHSNAAVFVIDSEGDIKTIKEGLCKGRDEGPASIPMAIGVAHPCVESWLLSDPDAIRKGMNLDKTPNISVNPEDLPAPQKNRSRNPKTVLRETIGLVNQELSAEQKDKIAAAMSDMDIVRKKCRQGFAPFADEVESYIRPLFSRP